MIHTGSESDIEGRSQIENDNYSDRDITMLSTSMED